METYIAAKHQLVRHQTREDVAVLGWDNVYSRNLNVPAARTIFFSAEVEFPEGAFQRDETLVWRWAGAEYEVCRTSDLRLRGRHNVLNVLAACAISGAALALREVAGGAMVAAMRAGITGFSGVEHRLEFVREHGGVKWYNDSIASAPERVIAALKSFDEPIVLLAGGRDKKLPWEELAALAKTRVKHLVLFGEAGPLIQRALEAAQMDRAHYTRCGPLAEAVALAARTAQPGDIVLLSPGCTSFDEFKDFAERGEKYKEWINAL
jgi:UDP-N-acetylmuramoylalanine--D-glutamate ligase